VLNDLSQGQLNLPYHQTGTHTSTKGRGANRISVLHPFLLTKCSTTTSCDMVHKSVSVLNCLVLETKDSDLQVQGILQVILIFDQINAPVCKHKNNVYISIERPRGRSSSPGRVKNFHFPISSRSALVLIQPPIQLVLGDLSPGMKRQEREADHSPPTNAEAKKAWIYTSTPSISLHGVVLN
jgi:hypothetical protein